MIMVHKMRCCYTAVNVLPNPHKVHPTARPLWAQILVYTLLQSLQWCVQYCVLLERIITALCCSFNVEIICMGSCAYWFIMDGYTMTLSHTLLITYPSYLLSASEQRLYRNPCKLQFMATRWQLFLNKSHDITHVPGLNEFCGLWFEH